jgi:GH24 family phage-related lysozyme (muramidase)
MDVNKLKKELAIDEGVKHEIYLDHLGYPTFGIGHLIKKDDPEYGSPVKTPVSEERVDECFKEDIKITLGDCLTLYDNFYELPEEVQLIIANMMFNMGLPRLSKFRGMKRGVDARDWNKAADEMVDSRWYSQVPNRSARLVERMRALATDS